MLPQAPWATDALLIALRWLHALAAVALLGWALVYFIDGTANGVVKTVDKITTTRAQRFKEVADLTLLVFLGTGAILSFDRLARGAGTAYAIVLAVKVLLSILVYQYALRWRRAGLGAGSAEGRVVLLAGAVVILLAAILKGLFERGLRSGF